ncbi:MAG: S8 family serine peptidase [Chromatiales bacterium]|nr:S8 family serine peptidase [Chromatiales bacterium]
MRILPPFRRLLLPGLALSLGLGLAVSPVLPTAASPATSERAAVGVRLRPLAADARDDATRVYIIQFREPPAVAEPAIRQDAGLDSGEATGAPLAVGTARRQARASTLRRGENRRRRFDAGAPAVRRYADQLTARHDAALDAVGARNDKLYSYRYALNGVAARLTPAQARKLRARKDVRQVWEDRPKYVETNDSAIFLGLTDPSGGLRRDLELRGEDIVIGVIDSGIAPGHPSLDDREPAKRPRLCRSEWGQSSLLGLWLCQRFKNKPDTLVYGPLPGWQGTCEAGERFLTTSCNNKLIGARYYIDGFLEKYDLDPNEFISPRDADGHGTHIATTAAGNFVQATLAGNRVARINGMAPRARVAVYKACWLEPGAARGTCSTADLARAIEDAVADGVDIINYSVGSDDGITDADDLALLAAADAGVLTVAAAGNEGPAPGSMNSPAAAPWVVAVGASSRRGDRFRAAIRVNSPASVRKDYPAVEAAFTPRLRDVGPLTLRLIVVDDNVVGSFDGVAGSTFDGCESIVNTAEVTGQVALMQRGGCSFEVKIRNAQTAGAKAVVVFSNQGEPIVMTVPRNSLGIPALMIGQADGQLLRDRLVAKDPVEVTLDSRVFLTVRDQGNQMQGFSSRGPSKWAPDVLKPDVTAPGADILAGHTPDVANNVQGERFQYLSGTSMAAPHVAGVAALLKQAHPDWSPAALRSALVTTARQDIRKEDNSTAADPFDFGGGHLVPNRAVKPGLVYDAGTSDYDAFLCGRGEARLAVDCAGLEAAGFPTGGSDLNQPSIAIDELVSSQVVRRRVTNVGDAGQFTASVTAPTTIDVEVTPAVLTLGAGESADVQVSFTTDGTTLDAWQFGALTWTGAGTVVRSPLAIRALPFAAPVVVRAAGTAGSLDLPVRVGYSGSFEAVLQGLEASGQGQSDSIQSQLTGSVLDDPYDMYEFVQPTAGTPPDSVRRIPIVVPAGTRYLRVALFNQNSSPGADLDLYLYRCPGFSTCTEEAEASVGDESNEAINVIPAEGAGFVTPGEYYVDVHGFDAPAGAATFRLFVWTVGADRGNASVTAPSSVTAGTNETLSVSWQGLETGLYLGLVTHTDGANVLDQTVIEITAP